MGSTLSTGPSSLSERKKKLNKREEEKRRKLLEKYGVLIPPVFLANKTDDPPLSTRVWERIQRESAAAQGIHRYGGSDLLLWAYRRTKADDSDAGPLLGQTLLAEYMTPGLFVSLPVAASVANDGGRFLAALVQPKLSGDNNDEHTISPLQPALPSFLSLTKTFHRNSSLFFPFPFKVETFLPQHALLSSSPTGNLASGILPSSTRVVADLSTPGHKNQTKVAWTTHFLDHPTTTTGTPQGSPLWTKLKGSWIEAETVCPDFANSGITLRMASAMTMDTLLDNVLLEACRFGRDAYRDNVCPESTATSTKLDDFLRKPKKANPHDETVRLRLAAEYKESILASNTNVSLSSLFGNGSLPVATVTDTLLSLNLNGGGDETPENHHHHQQQQPPPPLWLTLKQSKGHAHGDVSSFSLNLSQVVTFDREIWNILEERAPKVRNHLGWVCQIERLLNQQQSRGNGDGVSSTAESSSASILTVGASAQFNRNIATKVLLESKLVGSSTSTSSDSTSSSSFSSSPLAPSAALKWAVVFKRWLEPQATLSVLSKVDLFSGKFSFLGVGLEIEQHKPMGAAKPPLNGPGRHRAEYRDSTDMDSSTPAPPTRVELPRGRT